jgi:hypothetical protein
MLHYNPRHVSSSTMLILRRPHCIITAYVIITLCKRLYSTPVESRQEVYAVMHGQKNIKLRIIVSGTKMYYRGRLIHTNRANISVQKLTFQIDLFNKFRRLTKSARSGWDVKLYRVSEQDGLNIVSTSDWYSVSSPCWGPSLPFVSL